MVQELSDAIHDRFGNRVEMMIGSGSLKKLADPSSPGYRAWRAVALEGIRLFDGEADDAWGGKRVAVTRSEASSSLEKAKQFLSEAVVARTGGRHDAAMLCAIHAGISASDAVAVALAGVRSSDPDHSNADLLDEVGGGARPMKVHAAQLRQLLAKKTSVEYQSRRATSARRARRSRWRSGSPSGLQSVVEAAPRERPALVVARPRVGIAFGPACRSPWENRSRSTTSWPPLAATRSSSPTRPARGSAPPARSSSASSPPARSSTASPPGSAAWRTSTSSRSRPERCRSRSSGRTPSRWASRCPNGRRARCCSSARTSWRSVTRACARRSSTGWSCS